MPKRSAEEKIERYQQKIKKLQESKQKRRRVRIMYSDSSEDEGAHLEGSTITAEINSDTNIPQNPSTDLEEQSTSVDQPQPAPPQHEEQVQGASVSQELPVQSEYPTSDMELDPELLEALGEPTDDTPEYGANVHESLSKLWIPILKKGMSKENKDKLLKDYLVPDNCRLLQAPKLNAEISAAVPDMVRNRVKILKTNQQQLGFGITAINRALDHLLKGDDKKQAIQHLSNSCRILSDLHSTLTRNRIKLVTPSHDKSFLHVIQDSERDDTLFGIQLSDKIKAAKAIERQGLQIKKSTTHQKNNSSSQSMNSRANNSGNWTGQSRYQSNRGGRGGWKKPPSSRRPYQNLSQTTTIKPAALNKARAAEATTK